jgi:hypothetical protein
LALEIASQVAAGLAAVHEKTGQTPFRGTPAEVMYQRQDVPLPLEQLKGVAQPS